MITITDRLRGPRAIEQYGVHECHFATMLNQEWLIVEPDIPPLLPDGARDFTRYIMCGLCGGFRTKEGE